MRSLAILVVIVIAGVLGFYLGHTNSAPRSIDLIDTIEPLTFVVYDSSTDSAQAAGRWIPQNTSDEHYYFQPGLYLTEINCYRQTMKCIESRTMFIRADSDTDTGKYGFIQNQFEYDVEEWGHDSLKAILKGPGRIFEITLNFANSYAQLDVRDNPDNPTAAPYTETAILRID